MTRSRTRSPPQRAHSPPPGSATKRRSRRPSRGPAAISTSAHFTPTCGPRWSSNSIASRTHGGHMDRIDRRGFLDCMAWVGTGLVWVATGGVLSSRLITEASASDAAAGSFNFVQISDTHIGFKGEPNKDAAAPLHQAVDRVNGLRPAPALLLPTGDPSPGKEGGASHTS